MPVVSINLSMTWKYKRDQRKTKIDAIPVLQTDFKLVIRLNSTSVCAEGTQHFNVRLRGAHQVRKVKTCLKAGRQVCTQSGLPNRLLLFANWLAL